MDTINKQLKVRQVFYPTSQAAWEGINEIFIKGDPILFTEGECSYLINEIQELCL